MNKSPSVKGWPITRSNKCILRVKCQALVSQLVINTDDQMLVLTSSDGNWTNIISLRLLIYFTIQSLVVMNGLFKFPERRVTS